MHCQICIIKLMGDDSKMTRMQVRRATGVDSNGQSTALFAKAISEIRANPRNFRGEGVTE
jgi:hypothetical protein